MDLRKETRKRVDSAEKTTEDPTMTTAGEFLSRYKRSLKVRVSGTFARPPPLGPNWNDIWEPRKIEIKGWTEWSMKDITGLNDDQVKEVLEHLGGHMTADAKNCIDWAAYSKKKGNQGSWSRKTMVSLWFIKGTNQNKDE